MIFTDVSRALPRHLVIAGLGMLSAPCLAPACGGRTVPEYESSAEAGRGEPEGTAVGTYDGGAITDAAREPMEASGRDASVNDGSPLTDGGGPASDAAAGESADQSAAAEDAGPACDFGAQCDPSSYVDRTCAVGTNCTMYCYCDAAGLVYCDMGCP